LAKTCLTYLSFHEFEEPCSQADLLKKRVGYAARYWAYHAKEAEQCPDVQNAVLACLASEAKTNSILQLEAYTASGKTFTRGQTLLHVIAERGLATTCSLVLDTKRKPMGTRYVT